MNKIFSIIILFCVVLLLVNFSVLAIHRNKINNSEPILTENITTESLTGNLTFSENITKTYGIYLKFQTTIPNNWTDRDKKIYLLTTSFGDNNYPINVTLPGGYSKIYKNIFEFPLEDDCIEIGYNESCFVRWEIEKDTNRGLDEVKNEWTKNKRNIWKRN